jgi:hypothetical protein
LLTLFFSSATFLAILNVDKGQEGLFWGWRRGYRCRKACFMFSSQSCNGIFQREMRKCINKKVAMGNSVPSYCWLAAAMLAVATRVDQRNKSP